MRILIAPNGIKIVYNDSDERKVQRIIKKVQEIFDAKIAKRKEKQKEYFLRVRARCEDGRPIRRIDVKYLLEQFAERDKETERLKVLLEMHNVSEDGLKELYDNDVEALRQDNERLRDGIIIGIDLASGNDFTGHHPLPEPPEEGATQ
ncbi:MAG: hypothetical protein WCQ87_06610 [Parabacteroides sp.]